MNQNIASEINRLREEIHLWRMDALRSQHSLDNRLLRLEWQDKNFRQGRQEWRESILKRFKSLETRIEVFEKHKLRFAWLGWSAASMLFLGIIKIWLPQLKSFL